MQCRRRLCSLALAPRTSAAPPPALASEIVLDIAEQKAKSLKKIVSAELVLDFGEHKGTSLGAAPSGYLGWIAQRFRNKDGVKQLWAIHAQKVLDVRNERRATEERMRRQIVRAVDTSIRSASVEQVLAQLDAQDECVDPSLVQGSLLQRCIQSRSLADGQRIHEHILQSGAGKNRYLGNLLILMYGKCGRMDKARAVFESILNRNDRSYGIMMSLAVQHGRPLEALELWQRMEEDGVRADAFIVTSALAACTKLRALNEGRAIHEHLVVSEFKTDAVLDTALLRLYSKCGSIDDAKRVFEGMQSKDLFGWSAIISGLVQNNQCEEALVFYRRMVFEGSPQPNEVIYASALSACAKLGALDEGRAIHNRIVATGIEQDEVLQDAVLNMYARCGVLRAASKVFDAMDESSRGIVSWTCMMSAYLQRGKFEDAVKLYDKLLLVSRQEPNEYTYSTVLTACGALKDLKKGKEVHARIVSAGLEGNAAVQTALATMYGRCGCPQEARKVLEAASSLSVEARDVVAWSYAQQGHPKEALELYKRMQASEVTLTTLVSALGACCTMGALEEGKQIHERLVELGDEALLTSAPLLIHMYAGCGRLEEARQVFAKVVMDSSISNRDYCVSGAEAMMGAYAEQGHWQQVVELYQEMVLEGIEDVSSRFCTCVLWALRKQGASAAVKEGRRHFRDAVGDHYVAPLLEHYLCIVELLGRSRKLDEAEELLDSMPYEACPSGWMVLLRACKMHRDLSRGERAAAKLLAIAPEEAAPYAVLASMYDDCGRQEDARRVRKRMASRGFATPGGGHSFIEAGGEVHRFDSGDDQHPRIEEVKALLLGIAEPLKQAGYAPCTREVLPDIEESSEDEVLLFHSERLAVAYGLLVSDENENEEDIRVVKSVEMCSDCRKAIQCIAKVVERRIVVRDPRGFHCFEN